MPLAARNAGREVNSNCFSVRVGALVCAAEVANLSLIVSEGKLTRAGGGGSWGEEADRDRPSCERRRATVARGLFDGFTIVQYPAGNASFPPDVGQVLS